MDIDDEQPDDNLFLITVVPLWYAHITEFLSTQTMPQGWTRMTSGRLKSIAVTMLLSPIVSTKGDWMGCFADV